MIKHIVIEGGHYLGLGAIGSLKYLNQNNFYDINNIKTIYGTSIGAFIGVILALKVDWDILLDYIINRPWEKVISIENAMFLDMLEDKGFFDETFFKKSLENLFLSKDITLNITLKEFYDITKIELHIFTIRVNNFSVIDYSHKTHPSLKVIDAVYRSCSIPYIFKPQWDLDSYFIDGGVLNNYPVKNCIENGACQEELLGIRFEKKIHHTTGKNNNIFQYSYHIHQCLSTIASYKNDIILDNEIVIPYDVSTLDTCMELLKKNTTREEYIKHGETLAACYLESRN